MNLYMILIHGDDEAFVDLPREQVSQMLEQLRPFEEAVQREGKLLSTNRLHPASSSTLMKIRKGKRSVMDGPFTESKEQLGGYFLIEADSKEQVIGWMELLPPLMDSTLELRQVIDEERSVP